LVNQISLSWGVRAAFYFEDMNTIDEMIDGTQKFLQQKGFLKKGDVVVNTGSMPISAELPTNMVKITKID
jgi:pyruvate kinase